MLPTSESIIPWYIITCSWTIKMCTCLRWAARLSHCLYPLLSWPQPSLSYCLSLTYHVNLNLYRPSPKAFTTGRIRRGAVQGEEIYDGFKATFVPSWSVLLPGLETPWPKLDSPGGLCKLWQPPRIALCTTVRQLGPMCTLCQGFQKGPSTVPARILLWLEQGLLLALFANQAFLTWH